MNDTFEKHLNDPKIGKIFSAISKRFGKLSPDEKRQACLDGLWKAVLCYDNRKNVKFTTYVYKRIWWELLNIVKTKHKYINVLPIHDTKIPAVCLKYDELIRDIKEQLTYNEYLLFKYKYIDKYSLIEISKLLSVCIDTVRNRLKNIKRTLKKNIF